MLSTFGSNSATPEGMSRASSLESSMNDARPWNTHGARFSRAVEVQVTLVTPSSRRSFNIDSAETWKLMLSCYLLNSICCLVLAIYSCIIAFLFSANLVINTWNLPLKAFVMPPSTSVSCETPRITPFPYQHIDQSYGVLQSGNGPYRPSPEQTAVGRGCLTSRKDHHYGRTSYHQQSFRIKWNRTPAKSSSSQEPSIDSVFLKCLVASYHGELRKTSYRQ